MSSLQTNDFISLPVSSSSCHDSQRAFSSTYCPEVLNSNLLEHFPYLSEPRHVLDLRAVGLDPGDLGHGRAPGLADDLGARRVGEVHVVGRLLDEHGPGGVRLAEGWKGMNGGLDQDFSGVLSIKDIPNIAEKREI